MLNHQGQTQEATQLAREAMAARREAGGERCSAAMEASSPLPPDARLPRLRCKRLAQPSGGFFVPPSLKFGFVER